MILVKFSRKLPISLEFWRRPVWKKVDQVGELTYTYLVYVLNSDRTSIRPETRGFGLPLLVSWRNWWKANWTQRFFILCQILYYSWLIFQNEPQQRYCKKFESSTTIMADSKLKMHIRVKFLKFKNSKDFFIEIR